jgi:hypothetical protein
LNGPEDWQAISAVAGKLASLSSFKGVTDWLQEQWNKRPGNMGFPEFIAWGDASANARLAQTNWPRMLLVNWALGRFRNALLEGDSARVQQAQAEFAAASKQIPTNLLSGEALTLLQGRASLFAGTAWDQLPPVSPSSTVSAGTNNEAILKLGDIRLNFRLVELAADRGVFVGIGELSCGDLRRLGHIDAKRGEQAFGGFNDETRQVITNQGLASLRKQGDYAELYKHPAFALFNLIPVVRGKESRIELRPLNANGNLPPQLGETKTDHPVNAVSASRASPIAQAFGCRLLSYYPFRNGGRSIRWQRLMPRITWIKKAP